MAIHGVDLLVEICSWLIFGVMNYGGWRWASLGVCLPARLSSMAANV